MPFDPSTTIHPSAIVEDGAIIGADCFIGPFCYIGPEVKIGDSVKLFSHVVIAGDTKIGDGTKIWPFASVGHQPQDLKYKGEKTRLEIGKNCQIRESVSISPGTESGGGITRIGDSCLMMLGAHVGHDCIVGDRVILANNVSIAGHVTLEDDVIIGGLSGVHQFCKIGRGAMIGGLSAVASDVIPFGSVVASRPSLAGLNLIGLKRRGSNKDDIKALRSAFNELFNDEGTLKERAEMVAEKYQSNQLVMQVTNFLLSDSSRSFMTPDSGK